MNLNINRKINKEAYQKVLELIEILEKDFDVSLDIDLEDKLEQITSLDWFNYLKEYCYLVSDNNAEWSKELMKNNNILKSLYDMYKEQTGIINMIDILEEYLINEHDILLNDYVISNLGDFSELDETLLFFIKRNYKFKESI
jgi:hypothetical protein